MKILVIEDDATLGPFMAQGLNEAGFTTDVCSDGKAALIMAVSEPYDLIVLDRMLPNVDGMTILHTLRASAHKVPVIIVSALDEVDQRVAGLAAGADDYLTKPFAFKELLARVEALLRRPQIQPVDSSKLQVGAVRIDLRMQKAWLNQTEFAMQPRELRLLEYLMRHAGQIVSRTMLLENVWDYHFDPQTNVVDVHISRLRQKLSDDTHKNIIRTVRGAGYVFESHH